MEDGTYIRDKIFLVMHASTQIIENQSTSRLLRRFRLGLRFLNGHSPIGLNSNTHKVSK